MKWWHVCLWLTIWALLLPSCKGGMQETETNNSAFGVYADSIDTLLLHRHLEAIVKADTISRRSDRAVRTWYHEHRRFVWFSNMGVSADADSLLAILQHEAPRNGLDTTAFHVPQIAEALTIAHQLAFDSLGRNINELLPELDYWLTKAYVSYTAGLRYGFVRPAPLFNKLEHKTNSKDPKEYAQLFDYEIKAPDYEEAIGMLTSEKRMPYLLASQPSDYVSQQLMYSLAKAKDIEDRKKLAVNLERCRWQTDKPIGEERYILANIPAQQLWAVCADSVIEMRICCGATTNKTPLLSSQIKFMQVNPDWIVPQTIVESDFLRHAGDSAYFARNNYYIMERSTGDTLNPVMVDAEDLKTGQLRVGQKGGSGNSLGRIVFRFDNRFSIYLHDTNNHNAFKRERRTLSHGCVRVEKPFELACFLLPHADEWQTDRLRISMDIPPISNRGEKYLKEHEKDPRPLKLITYQEVSPRVPIYIIYQTAYPTPTTNKVELWPDIYGYDKVIEREMKQYLIK